MRAFQLLTLCLTLVLTLGITPVSAQTALTDAVKEAGQRAANRVAAARRDGLPVDTAIELVAEHDKLCITSFRVRDVRQVVVLDTWCTVQEGAYELRRAGLSRATLRSVEQYILRYPLRGSWATLERDVFKSGARFAYVQHLVRNNDRVRQHLLSLIVGHQASFINPQTREIIIY